MKILSLDLGSNSIGATIRDTLEKDNQFIKTTVITFETGVGKDDKGKFTLSHAAQRTSKRSLRRLYQSRKYKLWETLVHLKQSSYCPIDENSLKRWKYYNKEEALKGNGGRAYPVDDILFSNWIKLDFNNDNKPDYTSPYQLRQELVTEKLDFGKEKNKYKLGRALYHIAQHRGFKSSKKLQNADDERNDNDGENFLKDKGAEGKKRNRFWIEIDKLGYDIGHAKTVGEVFRIIEDKNRTDGTNVRIRRELHQFVTRKMLMQEVEEIFTFQNISFDSVFKKENGEKFKISQSPIFWQRPLRSQKGTIGKCTLEPNKFRCSESHPKFEEFRAWSFLNNIKYTIKGSKDSEPQQLPIEYRQAIYEDKFFRVSKKDFNFYEIAEWIKFKNGHDNWQLNYDFKTNVSACPVSAHFKSIFGDDWKNYKLEADKKRQIRKAGKEIHEHTVAYTIEDIWHVLFASDDEDFIEGFAEETLKLDDKKTNKLLALFSSMPVAYGMLSLKAINNILPFLKDGFIYTEAALLAKVPKIVGDDVWSLQRDKIIADLKIDVIDRNREKKRILNIVNNLIAQYKALPQPFARNTDYKLGDRDKDIDPESGFTDANQITNAIEDSYGKHTWKEMPQMEKDRILKAVTEEYQSFFSEKGEKFKMLPHLQKSMKQYLSGNFPALFCPDTFKVLKDGEKPCDCKKCKTLNTLYHPSQISIYPPAKEGFYKYGKIEKRMVMLGSPKTGSFKNPMAMRALHELRKFINYLIATEQVDEQTKMVVEIPRDSNLEDNNKRWAWNEYQARRREENKEFRDAIYELINDPDANNPLVNPDLDSDIDKFRIWYEMIEGDDAVEGFEKDKKFIPLQKTTSTKTKKGKQEEVEDFNEDNYLKINKSLFFKLQKAKDNIQTKYKLWKEQSCRCLYTGKMIGITDLFQENVIDFEHTIPRSKSLDNSLANLTVCYADFNRNVKKNRLPSELDNYDAIIQNIEKWEQKVKDLQLHVDFWKNESKRATTKERKEQCIRQRHLWEFDLKYWEDKVSRFKMKEVKSGFRKSQLVDTQIISKYAMHYLKTFFNTVEVQKGETTATFRKIFGIQEIGTAKDRSKHSHHVKDAIVLSLIPTAAIRDNILATWYLIDEQIKLLTSDTEKNKQAINQYIKLLKEELKELIYQSHIPDVNAVINTIDEQLLINNIANDNALIKARKRIRSRGKIVPLTDKDKNIIYQTDETGNKIQRSYKDGKLVWKTDEKGKLITDQEGNKIPVYIPKEKWAQGDSIRGQLHLDTFYGKIKITKRDENGKLLRDENGHFIYELAEKNNEFIYKTVLRKEIDKDFDVEKIVDEYLKAIVKKQLNGRTIGTAITEDGGIWMINREGKKSHKIRHIRCYIDDVKNPVAVRKQLYQHSNSENKHKNYYWAKNAENSLYGFYWDGQNIERGYECINLFGLASFDNRYSVDDATSFFSQKKDLGRGKNKLSVPLYAVFKPDMKFIFYKNSLSELKELSVEDISKRLYKMNRIFDSKQGLIQFHHHLEARDDKELLKIYPKEKFGDRGKNGFSEVNFEHPYPKLLLSCGKLNFAIEDKHFQINPDGEIKWL